jgi:hypothetical protein
LYQGRDIFKRGLRNMPNTTVYSAVATKRADTESKCLWALATVWELESAEKHVILLQTILRDYAQQYLESNAEAFFFKWIMVR